MDDCYCPECDGYWDLKAEAEEARLADLYDTCEGCGDLTPYVSELTCEACGWSGLLCDNDCGCGFCGDWRHLV